jgi:signal transduction histidine kinase
VTLLWLNLTRYDDFQDHHKIVATQSVANISNEISRVINERTTFLENFTREYEDLIHQQIQHPQDEKITHLIDEKLKQHFPNYFSFTIARADGTPIIDDFDNKVGELCLEDLRHFAKYYVSKPRIHPNEQVYHFDLMTSINKTNHIFFINFNTDNISQILRNNNSLEHDVMIVMDVKGKTLIEITAEGPRIKTNRDSYFLLPKELQRILYRKKITGTSWSIIDLHKEELFHDYREKLIIQTGIIIIPFILFVIGILILIKREERLKHKAELARDEFLSTVSHELRTPLTAIHGALRLITHGITGKVSSKTSDLLIIADKNCFRLIHLVNELLDMRKFELGKMEYHFKKINLIKLIHEVITLNTSFASEYGSKIIFNTDLESVIVNADENRLIQVLTNLISNAVKYGKSKDMINITCTLQNNVVRVSVIDHGIGIPMPEQKNIFDKFSRGSSTRASAISGTGLGLSICKNIIEDHGGEISFSSSPNMGSTFYFKIPYISDTTLDQAHSE